MFVQNFNGFDFLIDFLHINNESILQIQNRSPWNDNRPPVANHQTEKHHQNSIRWRFICILRPNKVVFNLKAG